MYRLALLISFLFFFLQCTLDSFGQGKIVDTNFIVREIKTIHDRTIYHAVFIDSRKTSPYYEKIIVGYSKLKPDTCFTSHLPDLDENIEIDQGALRELPKNWCPLELYKGEYYLFTRNFNKTIIRDSAVVFGSTGESAAVKLYSLKKIRKQTFQLKVAFYPKGIETIIIHIINPRKQVAIFEYRRPNEEPISYRLMVGEKGARSFPIIVDYSPQIKPQIFMFDNPDYEALLKAK